MKKGEMLSAAIKFAVDKHAGQFDNGGNPYILHVLKVMYYLKSDDEELNCIAILHDVVEDTDATYEELYSIGMTLRVVTGVNKLTKQRGQTHEEYKEEVKSSSDTIKVKKCDLRHNSDIRRLKGVTEKDVARIAKYMQFYSELQNGT